LLITVGIGNEIDKSDELRAAVIDDLTFDPDVDASDIRVEETDGDVVLTGSVPSYPQYVQAAAARAAESDACATMCRSRTGTEREAAELMVAELTGVRRVRNDIQIHGLEQA
jgi:osmotically-inducible protein OsmY